MLLFLESGKKLCAAPGSLQQPPKPLQIEGPPPESNAPPQLTTESGAVAPPDGTGAVAPTDGTGVVAPTDGTGTQPPTDGTGAPPLTAGSESGIQPPATESGARASQLATDPGAQLTPDSGVTPTIDSESVSGAPSTESSASGSLESEHINSNIPLENQTPNPSTINPADPIVMGNEASVNSLSSTPPPTKVPPSQKPEVPRPSGVRAELPMIDWT